MSHVAYDGATPMQSPPQQTAAVNVDGGPRYLVLGASGQVGSALTRSLASRGHRVRGFYEVGIADSVADQSGVETMFGTFDDPADLRRAMDGVEAAFILTPPSEHQLRWQLGMIEAAVTGGVHRIVKLSAFESGENSRLRLGRWHHEAELALAGAGCDYVILRPQYFMQNLHPAIAEATRTGVLAVPAGPEVRLGMVDVRDVADVAAAAMTTEQYSRQVLVPTGPEAFGLQQVAEEVGRAFALDVTYRHVPPDEARAKARARGVPSWFTEDQLKINGVAASPLVNDCVQAVLGRSPRPLSALLRELASAASAA